MTDATGVQTYFEAHAKSFDALYGERNPVRRWFNRVVRPSLYQRLDLAVAHVRESGAATLLDVGCGSGRNSIAFAQAGVAKVTGIDFSESMVRLSRSLARQHGVDTQCQFHVGDFLTHPFDQPFDATVALGVLDYVGQPLPFLKRMAQLSRNKVIVSAPGPSPVRSRLRRWRYARKGCPVFFYTHEQVRSFMEQAGLQRVQIHPFGPGCVAIGETQPSAQTGGRKETRGRGG